MYNRFCCIGQNSAGLSDPVCINFDKKHKKAGAQRKPHCELRLVLSMRQGRNWQVLVFHSLLYRIQQQNKNSFHHLQKFLGKSYELHYITIQAITELVYALLNTKAGRSVHDFSILNELFVVFLCATLVVMLFHRIKIPHIVGFLVCGVAVGPYGLDLITQKEDIDVLAEIGVALLLFTIGMEFSLTELRRIKRDVLLGGSLQVVCTTVVAAAIAFAVGMNLPRAIFLSQLFALSSTAIVLSVLAGRNQIDSPHGRMILGILLFQDLCVVPMMLITPLLGATGGIQILPMLLSFGKAMLLIGVVLLLAIFIVPRLLEVIVRVRLREILVLGVVVIAIGIAWVTSLLGLSLALGAFIAGLAISESPYSHQVTAEILPFKDVFNSLFFISVGMLLDVRFLVSNIGILAILVVGTVIGKMLVAGTTTRLLSGSNVLAVLVGLSIAQIGEFSFVLAKLGQDFQLLSSEMYQGFLAVAVVTMILAPFMMNLAPVVARRIPQSLPGKLAKQQEAASSQKLGMLRGHAVIVGFGLNGRYLARVLKESHIPYAILEMNPQTVREAQQSGEPIYFGDASRLEILQHVNLSEARILVITVAELPITRRIVSVVRQNHAGIYIIVRTKFASSVEELYHLGANQVIAEEFEAATEIFAHVLAEYNLPRTVIDAFVESIRREGLSKTHKTALSLDSVERLRGILAGSIVENFLLLDNSPAAGKTLAQLDFRNKTGATVIAIVRENQSTANPPANFALATNDLLVVMGTHKALEGVKKLLF